jgi:hypothetical protein
VPETYNIRRHHRRRSGLDILDKRNTVKRERKEKKKKAP